MKAKFFNIVICIFLLITLMPTAALAINHISLVELSVAVPVHGAIPEKPETTHDRVSVYAYEWYQNGDRLYYGETFEGGQTCTLKVRLSTLDEFMKSVSVKVNNMSAKVLSVDNNNTGLLLEIDFYVTPLGYKLSFDPGYGSGTMAPLNGKNSYILPECTFTPPAGKEFRFWQIENVTGEYLPGENIILTKDTTVRAIWGTPSGKTRIYDIEATSNIADIAILYGHLNTPNITVTKGTPATILTSSSNLRWQKKVNGSWETQSAGFFTAGEWRIQTQVRIDGDDAAQYELGNPTTLKVDGVKWTTENNGAPNVHYDYSMISVYSPGITIKDDPSIKPPVGITKVALSVTGYNLGAKAQNAKVTVNHEGVIVTNVVFAVPVDTNNDGFPDDAIPAERFEAGKQYSVIFTLKAKDGYDLSTLGMTGVTFNNTASIGSYNKQDDCYNGMGELPPIEACTVTFLADGGKGTMASVTVEKGAYSLPQNGFTAPEGKQFKAWSVGGKELAPGSKITLSTSITVTAVWDELPEDHSCKAKPIARVAPTCTEEGKQAYYLCEDCGKFYEDDACKNEISDLSAWGKLKKLGHADTDHDGKCDTCGLDLTPTSAPEETDGLNGTAKPEETSRPNDTAKSGEADETAAHDSSTSNNNTDMMWLWIVLSIVLVLGAAVTTFVIIRMRSSAK